MDKDNPKDFTFAKLSDLKLNVTFRMYGRGFIVDDLWPIHELHRVDPSSKEPDSPNLSRNCWIILSTDLQAFSHREHCVPSQRSNRHTHMNQEISLTYMQHANCWQTINLSQSLIALPSRHSRTATR